MCERHGLNTLIQNLFSATAAAPIPAPSPTAPAAAPGPVATKRRRKLWELEEKLHCPVVGTCLTLEEIQKIARKCGFQGEDFDAHRLHVEAVSLSCARNAAAEAMQRLLERKYAHVVRRFEAAKTDAEVLQMWRSHLERGEVAAAMWAGLTHKAASAATRQAIHADVHMLSHQVGAGQTADLRRLAWLEKAHAELERKLRLEAQRHARELAERQTRLQSLQLQIDRLRAEAGDASALRARIDELESGQAMVAMGRRLMLLEAANAELRETAARVLNLQRQVEALTAENARLRRERDELGAERNALERLWSTDARAAACQGDCDGCPNRIAGRCVLCVGGRAAMLAHYRALAARLGVRLIHHDGGREESLSRLPELLAAADAVICPTDCVSHAAYYQIKRHCKTAGKPCVMARSSGLAGIAAALTRLAEGQADIRTHPLEAD